MKNLSIVEFADLTASKEPVPGGGSISALCGALSGALAEMVANLTIGKKKYSHVETEMTKIQEEAIYLRHELLEDIEKDSEAFSLVMDAYGLPKDSEEEKLNRYIAIQKGLTEASLVPFSVATKAYKVMELCDIAIQKGNINTKTDGQVAMMLGRCAVLGALLNVQVNLDSIDDIGFKTNLQNKVDDLKEKAIKLEAANILH